jgi:uncharacterized protein YndB with AHSA1/START domain
MNPASVSDTVIEQVTIKASAERIFEALTNPAQRLQWWVLPGKFAMTHFESDLRPGGKWVMLGTGYGKNVRVEGVYQEVDRPHLLSFTWLPDWQPDATESLVRFELEEKAGATTVRLTHSGLVTKAAQESHRGWGQILGWLQAYSEK